jgi:hypothetical protein
MEQILLLYISQISYAFKISELDQSTIRVSYVYAEDESPTHEFHET